MPSFDRWASANRTADSSSAIELPSDFSMIRKMIARNRISSRSAISARSGNGVSRTVHGLAPTMWNTPAAAIAPITASSTAAPMPMPAPSSRPAPALASSVTRRCSTLRTYSAYAATHNAMHSNCGQTWRIDLSNVCWTRRMVSSTGSTTHRAAMTMRETGWASNRALRESEGACVSGNVDMMFSLLLGSDEQIISVLI